MTAEKFKNQAEKANLQCLNQEIVNWGGKRLIDCFSTFTHQDNANKRESRIIRNNEFMKEAEGRKYYTVG